MIIPCLSKYWWDSLTPVQQWFIMDRYRDSKLSEDEYISFAYKNKNDWHLMNNWPNE